MAAIVFGLAAVMWWLWLIRLGATAPPDSRSRLQAVFAVFAPILTIGVGMAWWYGLAKAFGFLFHAMNLNF